MKLYATLAATTLTLTGAVVLAQGHAPGVIGSGRPLVQGTLTVVGPRTAHAQSEITVRAVVRNNAHQSWLMPVVPLGLAQLSLDVFDAAGHRMATVPPPVPRPGDDRTEPLAQGTERAFTLSLNVFSPPLPPGTYTVKWGARFGITQTAPVTFTLAP